VSRRVEVGIYLPQVALGADAMLEKAQVVEDLGFHSLWLYDHLYAPGLPEHDSFEGWTLASFLLARTSRLRVGHLVLCNNFRHPALLAKMAATLDVLSGGRVELGIGSGSVEVEHHQAGLPWGGVGERSARLGEGLEVITRMMAGSPASFEGEHYRVVDLPNLPRPVQRPRPPVHVGGIGPRRTLPLVARYADVWNVPTYGLAGWEESQRLLDAECERIGRDPATLRRAHEAILVLAPDGPSLDEARRLAERRYGGEGWGMAAGGYVGTPAMVLDRMAAMTERGISLFVFFTHDRAERATLELFAEQVLPHLGRL
jgi:alkanesulfonate monooxygenase SsuD/methylene tetrahydromethanopterin reductase-like flavin-dependent oxidoreductase (luciferase family)